MTEHQVARRQEMRRRAQLRKKRKKLSFSEALFQVRRSEVLIYLSRMTPGARLDYGEIAEATDVPVSAVRRVCEHLRNVGSRMLADDKRSEAQENPEPIEAS